MSALEQLIPTPRMLEVDGVDLAVAPERAWEIVRHANLARSFAIHALFAVRTLPSRLSGHDTEPIALHLDDLVSSPDRPGFQILADDPPHEVAVGAIGKVWQPDIPFVHVEGPRAFAAFAEPDFIKVAWALRVSPLGDHDAHVAFEVRVDGTDDEAWKKFKRYFRVIGIGSRFIRHSLLRALRRELGDPTLREEARALPGDDLLPDAREYLTDAITIAAPPERIWPWLVQMGCRRGGYYSIDRLDNAGVRSAREIHPELQRIEIGQVLPATPEGNDGFEVLRIEPSRLLVLGGLFDTDANKQLPFASPRPEHYWHVSWSFYLEPLDVERTRLHVRAAAAFPASGDVHALFVRPVHHLMETAQLRHLKARAEGTLRADDAGDVLEGIGGAARMIAALVTPFRRGARSHWGLEQRAADASYPGDALVAEPRWGWTHAVEIDAPAADVWPWIAQIGADRGGFYSYQWLENVVGCHLRNAEVVHPEWEAHEGMSLLLHPKMPPLPIVSVERGRYLLAYGAPDEAARESGKPWIAATWLFFLEPIDAGRSRLISRYRVACSDDLRTRLAMGPTFVEPIGFAMDRRMLLGVKERAERGRQSTVDSRQSAHP